MGIDDLARWHQLRADEAARALRVSKTRRLAEERKFHAEAAEIVLSFSAKEHERRLAEVEIDVKKRASESLERLGRALIAESKIIRHMLSGEGDDE